MPKTRDAQSTAQPVPVLGLAAHCRAAVDRSRLLLAVVAAIEGSGRFPGLRDVGLEGTLSFVDEVFLPAPPTTPTDLAKMLGPDVEAKVSRIVREWCTGGAWSPVDPGLMARTSALLSELTLAPTSAAGEETSGLPHPEAVAVGMLAEDASLSVSALAVRMNVSRSTVNRWISKGGALAQALAATKEGKAEVLDRLREAG